MEWFTVIALYEENLQRYCTSVEAESVEEAIADVKEETPGLLIAGVCKGKVSMVDSGTFGSDES